MNVPFILASGSEVRAQLLDQAKLPHRIQKPLIDEGTIRQALLAADTSPRDIADALAEAKARKISGKHPDAMVLGCDQVLACQGQLLSKPETSEDAIAQLSLLRGQPHYLFSAAVLYQDGKPLWRHIGRVKITMRDLSDDFVASYVARNWESIRHAVGCYKLEEEGVRLMKRVEGDYFHVLGMPLLELLDFLTLRGDLDQ